MAETAARDKYACPACGADAHWNAAKQALVCPFCGVESPAKLDEASGQIVEHDLVAAIHGMPDEKRGWQAERRSVKCQSCQAISVFDPARVAQRCDFCGSAQIVPYEQTKAPFSPESVLPFKQAEGKVREAIRTWYQTRWFAPNRLKTAAMTDTVKGVYLPYWTFDAQAHADWTAESGYYYYTTESYRDSDGRMQTRQVQHIRWQSSAGALDHFFDDTLVPASKGVGVEFLPKIEPFPTKELVPFSAAYVAGWVVEQYQIDLVAAAQTARRKMDSILQAMCASQVPGDTHRNLNVDADYRAQTFKHILVPIWLLTYTYGSRNFQVVVNGYTGEIAGKHPLSFWKIFFLVLAILAVAGFVIAKTK